MEQFTNSNLHTEDARRVLRNALVIIDQGVAESLAWGAGLTELTDLGAVQVCDLMTLTSREVHVAAALAQGGLQQVTLMISMLMHEAEEAIVAACSTAMPLCQQFHVVCCISEDAHRDELPSMYGSQCYQEFSYRIQHRMQQLHPDAVCQVTVEFLPLLTLALSSSVFVFPSSCAAVHRPHIGGYAAGFGAAEVSTSDSDSDEEGHHQVESGQSKKKKAGQQQAQGLAVLSHTLAHVIALLGYRPEAFCMGPVSKAIGRSLSFIPPICPPGHPAPPENSAAVVLIDRALDLVTPAAHPDLLVQRMFDVLRNPTPDAGTTDFVSPAAAMVPLPDLDAVAAAPAEVREADAAVAANESNFSVLPGTVSHPTDSQAEGQLSFLLTRKGRDAALFVRKWLREAARKENLKPQGRFKPGSVTSEELRSLVSLLLSSPACAQRHSSLIQLAAATAAALDVDPANKWDVLAAAERALLIACARGYDAVLEQLLDLCEAAVQGRGMIGIDDILVLTLTAYCVLPEHQPWFMSSSDQAPAFTPRQQQELHNALVKAASASNQTSSLTFLSSSKTEAALSRSVEAMMHRMQEASSLTRRWLGEDGAHGQASSDPTGHHHEHEEGTREGLLVKVARAVLDQRPMKSMHHSGTSLAGLLKSGLGRIGLTKKQPVPGDLSTVVLFVVGGITAGEAHEVRALVEARGAQGGACPNVIVGGSALLQPDDVLKHTLTQKTF